MLVNIISIILNNISQISEELGKFLYEREGGPEGEFWKVRKQKNRAMPPGSG